MKTTKTDPKLGKLVEEHLASLELSTPMAGEVANKAEQKKTISLHFAKIMEALGLDLTDDSLAGTPDRVGKMFVEELFYGLSANQFPKITTIENKMGYDHMLVENNIAVKSVCEHHFVVIDGLASVAYIPNEKVIGLSKINRIVDYFSRRPQVQERLTEQVFATLCYILDTEDVAVVIDAKHYCVSHRGAEDTSSSTMTSKLGGVFREGAPRSEFFALAMR